MALNVKMAEVGTGCYGFLPDYVSFLLDYLLVLFVTACEIDHCLTNHTACLGTVLTETHTRIDRCLTDQESLHERAVSSESVTSLG